jgi:hypothetical protein
MRYTKNNETPALVRGVQAFMYYLFSRLMLLGRNPDGCFWMVLRILRGHVSTVSRIMRLWFVSHVLHFLSLRTWLTNLFADPVNQIKSNHILHLCNSKTPTSSVFYHPFSRYIGFLRFMAFKKLKRGSSW